MKKHYDLVYLTNTPSFYKINLCKEIARHRTLLLVLYGYGSEAVNKILDNDCGFDYIFLHNGNANQRSSVLTSVRLLKLMRNVVCKKILFSGWMAPEYNFYAFLSPKRKNCILCESSILESHFNGIKGLIKKRIINRMSCAMPSGELQKKLFTQINYTGEIRMTGGVGIFHKAKRPVVTKSASDNKKYLYVGRLIACKNLEFLIDVFNKNGKFLTIVGKGELENALKRRAKDNIHFIGFIENDALGEIYRSHDIFILPSRTEPWGLVVEEAIYWGLPVIVSDRVGSYKDMVEYPKTGIVFKLNSVSSMNSAMMEIEVNYAYYKEHVERFDFNKRDEKQIKAYTELIAE
ncbi:glycosyltransferase [Alistipes sp.]|uniref:glycosyltransferase n=1 Tax=Alistipes sp. TaxID=1872444 RepID=UPI003AF0E7CA